MTNDRTDADIKRDIIESLYWDTRVDAADIGVFVSNGHVRLTGTVPTYRSWRAAREDALVIRGVQRVDNRVEVEISAELEQPSDDELQEVLTEVLAADPDLQAADLDVAVTDGRVALSGTVPTYWERELARVIASTLPGLRALANQIVVVPTQDHHDTTVADRFTDALGRNRHVDLSRLDIAVANGEINLSGQVDNPSAHQQILDIAVRTLGVTGIIDNLHVIHPDDPTPI